MHEELIEHVSYRYQHQLAEMLVEFKLLKAKELHKFMFLFLIFLPNQLFHQVCKICDLLLHL